MKYFLAAIIIAVGLLGFGYFTSQSIKGSFRLIEVKGLSEKVIRADIGEMFVRFSNNNINLEELYKKRVSDKAKVIAFLKDNGITDEEIVGSSMDTREYSEDDNTVVSSGITTVNKRKYFRAEDSINIRTKNIEKVEKIKSKIVKLSAERVFVTCDYSYKLTNFVNVKLEMMKEASENARKNAEVFIEPQGAKIGNVIYLRQGEVSIRGEDESETVENWNSKESTSINKKLRLVVRAGFSKKESGMFGRLI